MITVGVLSLQGAVVEHLHHLARIPRVKGIPVKTAKELEKIDALILPGGESTTMGKLLRDFSLEQAIVRRVKNGMPIWGTCAGMILLAKELTNDPVTHLSLMDISVRRNGYGGQLDSFSTKLLIPQVSSKAIPIVCIRAPYIEKVWGDVEVLAVLDGKIIAARQQNMLVTSFHPELTSDTSFHQFFIRQAGACLKKNLAV